MKTSSVLVIILVFGLIIAASMIGFSKRIVVSVPLGFHGLIRIGVGTPETNGVRHGWRTLTLSVPQSGEITLRSLAEFREMRGFSVSYGNDTELVQAFMGDQTTGTAFWHLNSPPKEMVFFFVGTLQEMQEFIQKNEGELYSSKK